MSKCTCGILLVRLETEPLGLLMETDLGTENARSFFLPLTPAVAQSLALAILAQPGVGRELKPELQATIAEEGQAAKQADSEFLKTLGVSA